MSLSPLTGEEMLNEPLSKGRYHEYNEPGLGFYCIAGNLQELGFEYGKQLQCVGYMPPREGDIFLNELETKRLLALARSKVYWAQQDSKPQLFFLLRRDYEDAQAEFDRIGQHYDLVFVDVLHRDAKQLTWHEKSLKTLVNIVTALDGSRGGAGPFSRPTASNPDSNARRNQVAAIFYGCAEEDVIVTFQILTEKGLLSGSGDPSRPITILAKGYEVYDEYRRGIPKATRDCFLICRFVSELDRVYDAVYKEIGDECEPSIRINRVKDVHHVDKIDDRIIEDIRRSLIVFVDLTQNNFNVGFEAGYALALDKVIVWTRSEEEKAEPIPFDIAMQNVLYYDPENLEEFKSALKSRIEAALRKAGGQSFGANY